MTIYKDCLFCGTKLFTTSNKRVYCKGRCYKLMEKERIQLKKHAKQARILA